MCLYLYILFVYIHTYNGRAHGFTRSPVEFSFRVKFNFTAAHTSLTLIGPSLFFVFFFQILIALTGIVLPERRTGIDEVHAGVAPRFRVGWRHLADTLPVRLWRTFDSLDSFRTLYSFTTFRRCRLTWRCAVVRWYFLVVLSLLFSLSYIFWNKLTKFMWIWNHFVFSN